MKQKLQTLFITLLICLLGGVNLSSANAAGVSIPQEKGSFISMQDALTSGHLTLTKCNVDGSGDGLVIGSTSNGSVITLKLDNSKEGDYILSFMSGAQDLTATVKVEVTSGVYKVSKDFNIENTGSWTPISFHCMELNNLPSGEVTMTLSVTSTTGSFAGNYGKFCVAEKTYYDPISSIDLSRGDYSTARYEDANNNVGNCKNGATATYRAYNSITGYATINVGLKFYNPGTITVTVTDAVTETVEQTKVLEITNDICKGYNTPTPFPLGNLTQGLKIIKFTMAITGATYLCNYANLGISVVPPFDAEVGQTGFATIGFPYATTLPEGVTGYAVTGVTSTAVTLTEVPSGTNIAAKTGLIIVAKQGSYTFPVVESGTEIENNKLVANTEGVKTATTEGEFYVLAVTNEQTKTVGLAKIAQNGTLANNRAYMPANVIPANGSAQPATFRFVFGDATTVTEVGDGDVEAVETVVYNLAGQRVNDNAKGLVVVKGRVYLKK